MPTSDDESSVGDGWDRKEEEWHGFSEAEGTGSNSSSSEDSDSSDDSDDSSDSEEEEAIDRLKRGQSGKANAFKEWALAQRRITVDGDTSVTKSNIVTSIELKSTIVHVSRKREEDMTPPPEELVVSQTDRKVSVGVQAPAETQG
jgi:ATP-dependent RNA helicase DHX37/DHR1